MQRSKRSDYSLFDCHFWVEVNSGFSGKMGIVHIQNDQHQVHFGLYLRTAKSSYQYCKGIEFHSMFLVSFCINYELFFIKTEEHGIC